MFKLKFLQIFSIYNRNLNFKNLLDNKSRNKFPNLNKVEFFVFTEKRIDKIFKLTFSGLDKFTTNNDLNSKLDELSEIKVIRIQKLANKNYGHADIVSKLDSEILKFKFESLKILGKSLKVRIREAIDEPNEILFKKYTYFDFDKLIAYYENKGQESKLIEDLKKDCIQNLYEFIHNFYIKTLTDNPLAIKYLLSRFIGFKNNNSKEFDKNKIDYDCIGENKLFEIIDFEKEVLHYEFYINYDLNLALMKNSDLKIININSRKNIGRNSVDEIAQSILVPIKLNLLKNEFNKDNNYENLQNPSIEMDNIDEDQKSFKFFEENNTNVKYKKQIERINFILKKFIEIVKNLEYTSYIITKNSPNGVYRHLNIKFNEDKILLTLMISSARITNIDLKIIIDALKYEFFEMSNFLSIYIAFNEKVIAEIKNSASFMKILGKENHLIVENNQFPHKENHLRIYPFDENENLIYLRSFKLENIFSSIKEIHSAQRDFNTYNIYWPLFYFL